MRADKYFSEKYGSRTKAQAALKKGLVLLNGTPLSAKTEVTGQESFVFLEGTDGFVSNGGKKLARALDTFSQSVSGAVAVDLGASTGGFTDCLLQRGASHVYCVDVGENQLDESLKSDPRVIVMDKTNARYLTAENFPEPVSVVTGDLSFISLRLILPAVRAILQEGGRAFLLFKPQFECEGQGLGKRGILPPNRHAPLLRSFYDFCIGCGMPPVNIVNAPVVEKKNIEYVIQFEKGAAALGKEEFLRRAANIV